VLDVVSKLGEEIEDFLNSVGGLRRGGELDERLDHWSIDIEFGKMGQRLYFFSDFFNFTFKLDPRSSHLKIVNNSEGFTKSVNGLLMFSLAHSVVSSLLSSKGGTFFDSVGKESNIFHSVSQLGFGIGEETLGVDDGLLTLNLGGSVRVAVVSGAGNFSFTGYEICVMLCVGGRLLALGLGDELVDKSNNVINDTFGSEVNL